MKLIIGNTPVEVQWECNESMQALKEIAKDGLTVQLSMFGSFEQFGPLGHQLPSHDTEITTQSGDIMLFCGDQIVVFYGSNTWAYTRLGRIIDRSQDEMRELLGRGDVTITVTQE